MSELNFDVAYNFVMDHLIVFAIAIALGFLSQFIFQGIVKPVTAAFFSMVFKWLRWGEAHRGGNDSITRLNYQVSGLSHKVSEIEASISRRINELEEHRRTYAEIPSPKKDAVAWAWVNPDGSGHIILTKPGQLETPKDMIRFPAFDKFE